MKNLLYAILTIFLFSCQSNSDSEPKPKTSSGDILYYLVAMTGAQDMGTETMKEIKVHVSNYNRENYPESKLRISNIYLGGVEDKVPIIVIRRFQDKSSANAYHQNFINDKTNQSFFKEEWKTVFSPLTQGDYRKALKNKSLKGFLD